LVVEFLVNMTIKCTSNFVDAIARGSSRRERR
jgi:hypothetical protein